MIEGFMFALGVVLFIVCLPFIYIGACMLIGIFIVAPYELFMELFFPDKTSEKDNI